MVALAPLQIQQWDLGQVRTGRSTRQNRRDIRAVHHLLLAVLDYDSDGRPCAGAPVNDQLLSVCCHIIA
jgi:hypothetical protein